MSTETGPAVDAEPRGHVPVPGPKGLPFLGNLPQFGKNPLAFFERLRGYGDMVSWRFGPNSCVFIADPECIGELLTETERTFDQPALGIAFRTVMGNGVVVARGPDWRRKRSLVQPSVRPKQVRSYAATMAGSTVELADTWSGGERIDIKREMAALTQRRARRTHIGGGTPAAAPAVGRAGGLAPPEIRQEFARRGARL
ncbi:cytochrome P450, partial [Streptomyces sp. NPDC059744]|uniref:cytochrome P450 n=1 Tax=Streptomyces sp. NPDC059744 TaxID=3346929 RepID=UPI0036479AD8